MGVRDFLVGLALGSACSSSEVTHNHHTTTIHNPIQYPANWDNYTDEKKLEWLKNRSYWHEYHELKYSLYQRAKFEILECDTIYYRVLDSLVKNKGDKTEAEQLFIDYLNKKYMFKSFDNLLKMKLKMEVDSLNDYIRKNYSSLSQFFKHVDDYYFDVKVISN